jgi:hypothetical protein
MTGCHDRINPVENCRDPGAWGSRYGAIQGVEHRPTMARVRPGPARLRSLRRAPLPTRRIRIEGAIPRSARSWRQPPTSIFRQGAAGLILVRRNLTQDAETRLQPPLPPAAGGKGPPRAGDEERCQTYVAWSRGSVRQPCNDAAPERDYIPPPSRLSGARARSSASLPRTRRGRAQSG